MNRPKKPCQKAAELVTQLLVSLAGSLAEKACRTSPRQGHPAEFAGIDNWLRSLTEMISSSRMWACVHAQWDAISICAGRTISSGNAGLCTLLLDLQRRILCKQGIHLWFFAAMLFLFPLYFQEARLMLFRFGFDLARNRRKAVERNRTSEEAHLLGEVATCRPKDWTDVPWHCNAGPC